MGEPFFKDVPDLGKNPGLFIWRIEKLAPVLQSGKHTLGKFHTGDSYIILSIVNVKNSLKMNIHFWLGAESSQDERGAAVRAPSAVHRARTATGNSRGCMCGSSVGALSRGSDLLIFPPPPQAILTAELDQRLGDLPVQVSISRTRSWGPVLATRCHPSHSFKLSLAHGTGPPLVDGSTGRGLSVCG